MTEPTLRRPVLWTALFGALLLSGVAGIINQVVWQRALKIFLGGSETLSAMTVVLVFMLGLGAGAALGGRVSERLAHPIRALGMVEAGLGILNLTVAFVLGLDISESVYAIQRLAIATGIPLRAVYGLASFVLLLPPTLLMGSTLPLASEACQRQLGASDNALVPTLFFTNTVGAAMGALGSSLWLLPYLGQSTTLFLAAALNGVAAAILLAGSSTIPKAVVAVKTSLSSASSGVKPEVWVGALLGFLSLGYEMVLFRLLSLAHEPLPSTFATGLCCYLLAWSVGMFLSSRMPARPAVVSAITAAVLLSIPNMYVVDRFAVNFDMFRGALYYSIPPLGFGILYGIYVSRVADDWGKDVGQYAAFNTLGSAAGILWFTLVGYEMPQTYNVAAIALGLFALAWAELPPVRERSLEKVGGGALLAAMCAVFVMGWQIRYSDANGLRTYWGRDGVVEISQKSGEIYIDGLWHTKMSDGKDHIGRPYSWLMAVGAVMAHRDVPLKRALVIGAGVGVSSVTLQGIDGLQVDGYEINHTLKRLLEDYPDRTLHALETDNVHWIWQDARTGMALNETTYDIILSAPLLLRQAGSSLLLSKEYLRLAKSRLEPDGILAIYSHEGPGEQSWLVQRTVAELFEHRVSWYDGTVTVASDHPIELTEADLVARLSRPDRLYQEMRGFDQQLRDQGTEQGLFSWYDGERAFPVVADRAITDDHPLVEYPSIAKEVVRSIPRAELSR